MGTVSTELEKILAADRAREILAIASEVATAQSEMPPRRADIVWHALKESMDTIRRLPDREAGWLYTLRGAWPEITHDYADQLDAYETMLERVRIGEEPIEALQVRRPPPSARSITRMEHVFGWHRYLIGRNRRRDWRVVCQLADGWTGARVGRSNGLHRNSVYDVRELQTAAIARGLAEAYGDDVFPCVVQTGQTVHHRAL